MLRYICTLLLLTACMSQPDNTLVSESAAIQSSFHNESEAAAPARDGNIAIFEEYEAAKQKHTVEAYGLFIARHPDHALTAEVKALLQAAQAKE